MRLGAAVSVLLLLFLPWPGGLRGESYAASDRLDWDRLELTYDVYVYGLYAMRWQVARAQDGSLYELGFQAHPDGPASLFSRVHIQAQAVGRTGDTQIVPQSYHSRYTKRAMRQVRITYGSEGRSLTASADPSANEEERPEVPAEAIADAIDPLNGAYALLQDIADTGTCDGAMRMFDGRRLFAVALRTDVAAAEEGIAGKDYATLRCRMELKRIAGFKPKELRKKRFPDSIAIEFAPIGPGGTYLPARMSVQHRVGPVRIELAEVRTSEGRFSAADRDRPASAADHAGTRTIR